MPGPVRQLTELAGTLAQDPDPSAAAARLLEAARPGRQVLLLACQEARDSLDHSPDDETKQATVTVLEQALAVYNERSGGGPTTPGFSFDVCGACGRRGAYLIPSRRVIRCRGCGAVADLPPGEDDPAPARRAQLAASLHR